MSPSSSPSSSSSSSSPTPPTGTGSPPEARGGAGTPAAGAPQDPGGGVTETPILDPEATVEAVRRAHDADDFATVVQIITDAWAREDLASVAAGLAALRPPDRVDVFETFDLEAQRHLLRVLADPDAADLLEELEDPFAGMVAAGLSPAELAPILDEMETDEAADVLLDLPETQQAPVLKAMDDSAEAEVRRLMEYEDDSAGGRMTRDFIALRAGDSVEATIEHLRGLAPDNNVAYYLYALDDADRLIGVVSLRQLIVAGARETIADLVEGDVLKVHAEDDQELAGQVMQRYDLRTLPVVDADDRLIGVITHDDLVDVLSEEATEDMYRLVGLDEAERPLDPVGLAVRKRLPWLALNLGMQLALVAALTGFRTTIDRVVALAVLFPLVTAQGGNVGAQAMTIVVRLLALGEFDRAEVRRLLGKEVAVGLINGVAIGVLAAGIAVVVGGPEQALVLGLAMLVAMAANLTIGGLIGGGVPLLLHRLGFDPAVASSVFVTTLTDTLGVLLFLGAYIGLAGWLGL